MNKTITYMKCVLLALMMAVAMGAWAESGTCGTNTNWELSGGKLTISGTGNMTSWISSSKVPWNSYRSQITSLVIGDGVTSIGSYAFTGCGNLASVSIPESVTDIQMSAFALCVSLKEVTLPASVKTLGRDAFLKCNSLAKVTFLSATTKIVGSNTTLGNSGSVVIYAPAGNSTARSYGKKYGYTVREIQVPTYSVTMAAGTKDAANWTIASGENSVLGSATDGLTGVKEGDAVTLTYGGRLKVKGVKATSDAAPVNATIEITTSDINEGDPSVVFNVKLSTPPQGSATVQVKVGETTYDVPVDATGAGTLTLDNANGEDAYLDASSVTAEVVGVTGGNYANIVTGQTATANIADTIDETTVEITTSNFTDSDPSIDFNVQISNPPQGSATVQVKVGETTYDVPVNANGYGTLTLDKADFGGASSVTAKVVGVTGGNYESVVTGQTATAQKN